MGYLESSLTDQRVDEIIRQAEWEGKEWYFDLGELGNMLIIEEYYEE